MYQQGANCPPDERVLAEAYLKLHARPHVSWKERNHLGPEPYEAQYTRVNDDTKWSNTSLVVEKQHVINSAIKFNYT